MSEYLDFAEATVRELSEHQSRRFAHAPNGELCFTISGPVFRTYHSLGERRGKSFQIYVFEECRPAGVPTGMDLTIWPLLDELATLTRDSTYGELVEGMVGIFADYGFDPRSGLPYWGVECELDVACPGAKPTRGAAEARFKFGPDLPYERLWERAPEKLARGLRSSYYGLVTRPETMDFNRFCYYGFDDRNRSPSLGYNPFHVAFASAAMWAVEGWLFLASTTGDGEALGWAKAMLDKWENHQSPDTGLIPHFLGAKKEGETSQTAQPYANQQDAHIAVDLLKVASRLTAERVGDDVLSQLERIALRLIRGIATHAYDADRRVFNNWLHVETGVVHTAAYVYHFHSQEQKQQWQRIDPAVSEVAVCPGPAVFGSKAPSFTCTDSVISSLAKAVDYSSDAELASMLKEYARLVMVRRQEFDGCVNEKGHWTFPATGAYIRAMLSLAWHTGDRSYVDNARLLADREIAGLTTFQADPEQQATTDWWRMPGRNDFLRSLLLLEQALRQ